MDFKEALAAFVSMAAERHSLGGYIQSQDFAADRGWLAETEMTALANAEARSKVLDGALPEAWKRLRGDWAGDLKGHVAELEKALAQCQARMAENRLEQPLDEFYAEHYKTHIPMVLGALATLQKELDKPKVKPGDSSWWVLREAPDIVLKVR